MKEMNENTLKIQSSDCILTTLGMIDLPVNSCGIYLIPGSQFQLRYTHILVNK